MSGCQKRWESSHRYWLNVHQRPSWSSSYVWDLRRAWGVRRMRAKTEAWDTSSPLHSGAQSGLRRGRAAERAAEVQGRGREEGSGCLSCLCSGWWGLLEGLHCGTQPSEGPGLGLKEVREEHFHSGHVGAEFRLLKQWVRVKYGGSRKV